MRQYALLILCGIVVGLFPVYALRAALSQSLVVTYETALPLAVSGEVLAPVEEVFPNEVLFVGDVMLSRSVEKLMRVHGAGYPYQGVRDLFGQYKAVVGNFEGTIPHTHVPTPSMGFSFSVHSDFIPAIKEAGFTHMTLANNHAYDFGARAFQNAQATLASSSIESAGVPDSVSSEDILLFTVGTRTVSVLPISVFPRTPTDDALRSVFSDLQEISDIQLVTIHWGDEYEPIHNRHQETLAKKMIDFGADGIIGHHPHVIQDVGWYKGSPIFYSLGNFIFDQYWEDSVKTGLVVGLGYEEGSLTYTLYPVYAERSNPKLLSDEQRALILEDIALRSDEVVAHMVRKGEIMQSLGK